MDPISLAIMGGLALTSALTQAIPGPRERENNRERRALEERLRRGQGGLNPAELQRLQFLQMQPARQMAEQQTRQAESMLAGQEGGLQASDLVRLQQAQQEGLAGAGTQAGLATQQADVQERLRQDQELEDRRALGAAYGQQRTEGLMNTASQVAGVIPGITQMGQMGLLSPQQFEASQQAMAANQDSYQRQGQNDPGNAANQGQAAPPAFDVRQAAPTSPLRKQNYQANTGSPMPTQSAADVTWASQAPVVQNAGVGMTPEELEALSQGPAQGRSSTRFPTNDYWR